MARALFLPAAERIVIYCFLAPWHVGRTRKCQDPKCETNIPAANSEIIRPGHRSSLHYLRRPAGIRWRFLAVQPSGPGSFRVTSFLRFECQYKRSRVHMEQGTRSSTRGVGHTEYRTRSSEVSLGGWSPSLRLFGTAWNEEYARGTGGSFEAWALTVHFPRRLKVGIRIIVSRWREHRRLHNAFSRQR